jgi:isoleucyl-tRNA synthetase
VIITEQPKTGWAVETGAVDTGTGETVALDLAITDELRRAGLVREVIRLVQEARKSTGLSITDRIDLWWSADGDLAAALREGGATVADEVLATSLTEGGFHEDLTRHEDADLGLAFQLRKA